MKAVVLVGGEGTRLRPLTLTRPKQMLPVGGRPMLERVLGWLGGHGVEEAVLSLGYRPDAFVRAYPEAEICGVKLRYAVEESPLDTAGAIRFAASEGGVEGTFIVVNGDVLTTIDVSALLEFHRARNALASIALTPVEDPSRFGVVPTDPTGRVLAFIEKPDRERAPTNFINAGTYVLEQAVLDHIPAGRPVSIERETFPALVEEASVFALGSDAPWLDAGTPAALLSANMVYAPHGPCSWPSGGAARGSVIGEGVELGAGALVVRSVLMDGVCVGDKAVIYDSIVGEGARIGVGARLERTSVIGDGFVVETGAEISEGRLPPSPS